jgi:hypothetical protein
MPREKMWVTCEDDAELSKSHTRPGSFSPLTREDGTNKLGHVTLDPIDDGPSVTYAHHTHTNEYADASPSPERAVAEDDEPDLIALVAEGVSVLAGKSKVDIGLWLAGRVAPAALKTVRWFRSRRAPRAASTPADMAREVSEALEFVRIGGSRIGARDRIVDALTAQLRDSGPLTPQQLGEGVRLVLEASPWLRDEATLTDLRRILEH